MTEQSPMWAFSSIAEVFGLPLCSKKTDLRALSSLSFPKRQRRGVRVGNASLKILG